MPDPALGPQLWATHVGDVGGATDDSCRAVFARLSTRYGEVHRRYHTLEHVSEVLGWIDRLASGAESVSAVRLAGWLHDVVYEPTEPGNERASADWARRELVGLSVPSDVVEETARLIETTETHEVGPDDRNGKVLADADLSILGAERDRYCRYSADVRAEYSFVPGAAFRAGRSTVLRALLEREPLYYLDTSRQELEARARENLTWELGELRG